MTEWGSWLVSQWLINWLVVILAKAYDVNQPPRHKDPVGSEKNWNLKSSLENIQNKVTLTSASL